MINAYFLISAFLMGWMFGVDYMNDVRWTFWERIGTVALSILWPFLVFLLWREWCRSSKK
jgi:hypothetical protein